MVFAQDANGRIGHRMHGSPKDHLAIEVPQRVAKIDIEPRVAAAKAAHPQTLSRLRIATQHAPDHPFFGVGCL